MERLTYRGMMTASLTVALAAVVVTSPAHAAERRNGGKLLLTDGVASAEGAAGGGLATWAVIAGNETRDGIGGAAHATYIALPDYDLTSVGAALGVSDRVELSYAYQTFDTRAAGAALGLGRGFTFGQHIIGAKLRVLGDAVWDQDTLLPQIAIGAQYKIAEKGDVIRAVGGRESRSVDFFIAATKVWLPASMVFNTTLRYTKANQFGLLGFGGPRQPDRTAQVEASAGRLVTSNLLLGVEYRMKPNNLAFAREDDAYDLFAAWAVRRNVSITAAYVDLGDIATVDKQRGLFLSLKGGF